MNSAEKFTDPLARAFINRYQGGFPICERPYSAIASDLGSNEDSVITMIEMLLSEGWLSRFGPLYDAAKMGGGLTLAALSAPEDQFQAVAACVNGYDEVAHNYRRTHALNMWFVVATETEQAVQRVLDGIESQTGLKVFNCPKQQEFYVGLKLHIDDAGKVDSVPMDAEWIRPSGILKIAQPLDSFQKRIIKATQAGLPLTTRPYHRVADQIDSDAASVMQELDVMLHHGSLRRIGAVPNHYKLGLKGNGMSVWNVPDTLIGDIGCRIGSLDYVSHCYQRPRHLPGWPYNLFAMVHGSDRQQVLAKMSVMEESLLPYNFQHEILFSTAILKKSGLRLAA